MVKKRYPSQELLAAGWSLGGNILVRYLGEEGDRSPISAAASLCNPLDLVSPSVHADASMTHGCSLSQQVVKARQESKTSLWSCQKLRIQLTVIH